MTTLRKSSRGTYLASIPSFSACSPGRAVGLFFIGQAWRRSMRAYRARMKSALDSLDQAPMPPEWRDNDRIILQNNIAFMDDCLAKGTISFAALEAFAKKQAPYLKEDIAWAAQTQVAHWMKVLADWKKML